MLTIIQTEFPHLTPRERTRDSLFVCDICYACEIDDITSRPAFTTPCPDLIPMYIDHRDGCCICQRCAESGAYLELGEPDQTNPTPTQA